MTDPAVEANLIRTICSLPEHDYGEVLRRLEDPAHARLPRGSTWSIFKAIDGIDRAERSHLADLIVAQRAKEAVTP